ncbi:hypothetical protein MKW92_045741, partial [Papaver armeniacum]
MYEDFNLVIQCLAKVKGDVWYGRFFDYTPTWPSYIYLKYQYQMDVLIKLSKRSDYLLWLLPYKNLINPISRDYLVMKMFPEVKLDFENQHKMLIDRSQILTESFEQLSLGTSKSLRCGRSVEFRNEEAVGYAPVVPRRRNYFVFAGRVIALALMHKVQVGITFDPVFFYQLAGGVISLDDIQDADPVMYKSCKRILEMDADSVDSDALGLTFVREFEEFGSRSGGAHCFVKSIAEKLSYFTRGFGDILCERGLQKIFFRNLELEDLDLMLLGRGEAISVKDWKAHTEYHLTNLTNIKKI